MAAFDGRLGVQVLVFPAAVKVYDETEFAIKRLISLRKHISRDEPAAYEEATSLLKRLTGYVSRRGCSTHQCLATWCAQPMWSGVLT